jgi:hypothetical protein
MHSKSPYGEAYLDKLYEAFSGLNEASSASTSTFNEERALAFATRLVQLLTQAFHVGEAASLQAEQGTSLYQYTVNTAITVRSDIS